MAYKPRIRTLLYFFSFRSEYGILPLLGVLAALGLRPISYISTTLRLGTQNLIEELMVAVSKRRAHKVWDLAGLGMGN